MLDSMIFFIVVGILYDPGPGAPFGLSNGGRVPVPNFIVGARSTHEVCSKASITVRLGGSAVTAVSSNVAPVRCRPGDLGGDAVPVMLFKGFLFPLIQTIFL